MPRYLLGQVKLLVCPIEAENEIEAIKLLNAHLTGEQRLEPNPLHAYLEAWIETSATVKPVRVATLQRLASLLGRLDENGELKAEIIGPNGKPANFLNGNG